jgi:hypothetical protein
VDGRVLSSDVVRGELVGCASQWAAQPPGTPPKDGNVMPKHVGATIHN